MTSPADKDDQAKRYAEVLERAVQAAVGGGVIKITTHTAEGISAILKSPQSANGTSERAAGFREGLEMAAKKCDEMMAEWRVVAAPHFDAAKLLGQKIRTLLTASLGNGQAASLNLAEPQTDTQIGASAAGGSPAPSSIAPNADLARELCQSAAFLKEHHPHHTTMRDTMLRAASALLPPVPSAASATRQSK